MSPAAASSSPPSHPFTFARLLKEFIRRTGRSKTDVAQALKVSPSQISRFQRPDGPQPDPVLCLRLAKLGVLDPFTVLEDAGHQEVAALLKWLFPTRPKPTPPPERLTSQERQWLEAFRALDPLPRRYVFGIVQGLVAKASRGPDEPRKTL